MTIAGLPLARIVGLAAASLLVLALAVWLSWQSPAVQDTVYCWMQENLVSENLGTRPDDVVVVAAAAETTPERTGCDAADDPAVWVDSADPSNSLIIGANKRESLSVFRLDGQRISERQTGGSNNVDVRGGISVGGRDRIIVGATSPRGSRIDLFELDPASGQLLDIAEAPIETTPEVETSGFCFYHSARTGDLFAITTDQSGLIEQRRLYDNGAGRIRAELTRQLRVATEQEGCVADEPNGLLFVGEENVGIWRFNAEPGADTAGVLVARTGVEEANGGRIQADVEGLAIYAPPHGGPDAGYLVASSQGNNTYVVFDRAAPHAYRGTFQLTFDGGAVANTDGLDLVAMPVGPDYPAGLLVVQDGFMKKPGKPQQNQNFKLVSWDAVSRALALESGERAGAGELADVEAVRDGAAVTVTWTADGPVDVLLSDDPGADPETMTVVSAQDTDGRHVVRDLGGITRPYFYLRAGDGSGQRVAVRLLPLEGGRNFRDLGGYPTRDGRRVRWGRVFRSGMMAHLTDADYDYLSALGIRVVCDFRSDAERASEPTRWRATPAIDYRTWDYRDNDSTGGLQIGSLLAQPGVTPEQVAEAMVDGYPHIAEAHKEKYREVFHRLAAGELPLAFNCSAGKDRAGTAAALILSALGVPREVVVEDYALSERMVDYETELLAAGSSQDAPQNASAGLLAGMPAEVIRPLLRSDPDYIRNTFAYLDETYGGVMGYVRSELEIDDAELERIRAALLE